MDFSQYGLQGSLFFFFLFFWAGSKAHCKFHFSYFTFKSTFLFFSATRSNTQPEEDLSVFSKTTPPKPHLPATNHLSKSKFLSLLFFSIHTMILLKIETRDPWASWNHVSSKATSYSNSHFLFFFFFSKRTQESLKCFCPKATSYSNSLFLSFSFQKGLKEPQMHKPMKLFSSQRAHSLSFSLLSTFKETQTSCHTSLSSTHFQADGLYLPISLRGG